MDLVKVIELDDVQENKILIIVERKEGRNGIAADRMSKNT